MFEPSISHFHPASCSRGFSDELGCGPFSKPAALRQATLGLSARLNNSRAGSFARARPLPQPTETRKFSNYTRQAKCRIPNVRDSHGTPKATASRAEHQFLPSFQKPLPASARLFLILHSGVHFATTPVRTLRRQGGITPVARAA